MLYRIIRQVPGEIQFELARLEIECDTIEDCKKAEVHGNAWVEHRKQIMDKSVLSRFKVAPPTTITQHTPHARAAAPAASAASAASSGELGFPLRGYNDLIERIMNACGLGAGQYDRQNLEENLLRAASRYVSRKDGTIKYSSEKSLPAMAEAHRAKGWNQNGVTKTWEVMLRIEKILESDGKVVLQVPKWRKEQGRATDDQVIYTLANAGAIKEAMATAGYTTGDHAHEEGGSEDADLDDLPF